MHARGEAGPWAGALALLLAVPLSVSIHYLNERFAARPELGVLSVGVVFVLLAAAAVAGHLAARRGRVTPESLGITLLALIAVELVAIYLYVVGFEVRLPADILIWAESTFVNDILKFRLNLPLYSPSADNEAFIYTPGAPLLTYLVSALFGQGESIPFFRAVQLLYALGAATVAFYCCRILVRLAGGLRASDGCRLWGLAWLPVLFLIATNALTNPYAHNLHNDSLALLVAAAAYLLLLKYAESRDHRLLLAMAVVPAAGFLVKQSLAIWAPLYAAFLVLFDRPRSWKRVLGFTAGAFGVIGLVLVLAYLLWGEAFFYWVFEVPGSIAVSPLRSFQHLLDTWPYWVVGLVGGLVLVSRARSTALLGAWAVWFALMAVESYTSGIAWMLNHLGPGSLLAGMWLLSAVAVASDSDGARRSSWGRPELWLRAAVGLVVLVLLFAGLGLVRVPVRTISPDVDRYVRDIEAEFEGEAPGDVLLDAGTWVYYPHRVVMKDRVTTIPDRAVGGTGDFSGILQRLEERRYSKILVRRLHAPDFWYEHYLWPAESGIKRTLLENYQEVRRIPGVQGQTRYLLSEISVLVPRKDEALADGDAVPSPGREATPAGRPGSGGAVDGR